VGKERGQAVHPFHGRDRGGKGVLTKGPLATLGAPGKNFCIVERALERRGSSGSFISPTKSRGNTVSGIDDYEKKSRTKAEPFALLFPPK